MHARRWVSRLWAPQLPKPLHDHLPPRPLPLPPRLRPHRRPVRSPRRGPCAFPQACPAVATSFPPSTPSGSRTSRPTSLRGASASSSYSRCLFPARSDTVQPQRKAVPVPLDGRGRDALAGPGHGRLCAVEARPQPRPSPQHPRRPVLATRGAQQGREESARHGRAAGAGLAEQRNQGAPFRS